MVILKRAATEIMPWRDPGDIARDIIAEHDAIGLRSPSESAQMIREDRDR